MANPFSERFIIATTEPQEIENKRVIEVGSAYYEWEAIYHLFKSCKEFVSIDLVQRYSTTRILDAERLVEHFGMESFDFVVSLFMLEHTKDWKKIVTQFKRVLKPNGILIVATPSKGCPHHSDYDAWRFELMDLQRIFEDLEVQFVAAKTESGHFTNYIKARKPENFKEKNLNEYKLYNIHFDAIV